MGVPVLERRPTVLERRPTVLRAIVDGIPQESVRSGQRSLGVGVIANGNQSPALDVPVDPSGAMKSSEASASSATGEVSGPAYDLDRLERALSALVDQNARLREESAALRHALDDRGERIRALEGQLLDANQRRQDVIKRVDELIAQMDALDAQLEQAEPDAS